MDGLPYLLDLQATAQPQQTLRGAIDCAGVGVHSGRHLRMALLPAAPGSGIVFRRRDLGIDIPARYDHVVDTKLCTVLGLPGRPEAVVGTIEHVMAALAGTGISNAVIEVDGPEVPILDGSSRDFVFLIGCAGIVPQGMPARMVAVRRSVRVTEEDAFAELHPATGGFSIEMSIDFADAAIGVQALSLRLGAGSFARELASARTFGRAADVAAMQAAGLARGGSLDNAVVVDGDRVLNPGGLRMKDEFVRHKMLDAVGDLALAGAPLAGRLVGHKSGHALNNRLLRALFADDANWAWADAPAPLATSAGEGGTLGGWQERRLPVAAAPV